MNSRKRKLFSPCDLLIIIAVVLTALCSVLFMIFQGSTENPVACIKINGEVYKELPLDQTQDVALENGGFHASVHIENGEVYFAFSECPDKLCVNQGSISKNGESIVCLPGRFSVTILSSGNQDDVDAVIH